MLVVVAAVVVVVVAVAVVVAVVAAACAAGGGGGWLLVVGCWLWLWLWFFLFLFLFMLLDFPRQLCIHYVYRISSFGFNLKGGLQPPLFINQPVGKGHLCPTPQSPQVMAAANPHLGLVGQTWEQLVTQTCLANPLSIFLDVLMGMITYIC